MICKAVRGATGVSKDKKELIIESVEQLVTRLFEENDLNEDNVVSITFSITRDLKAFNPAAALRKNGFSTIPLFCTQEPKHKGALKRVVRVLITFNTEKNRPVSPVYINGAERLRPDLVK